jgi:hypothetical protein
VRYIWDVEVTGSNPVAPTTIKKMPKRKVYTIGQIADAFYSNKPQDKVLQMAKSLLSKKKSPGKKRKYIN